MCRTISVEIDTRPGAKRRAQTVGSVDKPGMDELVIPRTSGWNLTLGTLF
jgi:hypothetical protein